MKILGGLLLALFVVSVDAPAQNFQNFNFDFSGGYSHISGDGGMNGYTVGTSVWFKRVALVFDYDRVWNTSRLDNFSLTSIGLFSTKSRMQNFLAGPRFYFPAIYRSRKDGVPLLTAFAEGEFGSSYLRQALTIPAEDVNTFASVNNFAWLLGGGADYRLSPHFLARLKMDLFRTHFVDEGQSRFRLSLQVVYNFRAAQPQ